MSDDIVSLSHLSSQYRSLFFSSFVYHLGHVAMTCNTFDLWVEPEPVCVCGVCVCGGVWVWEVCVGVEVCVCVGGGIGSNNYIGELINRGRFQHAVIFKTSSKALVFKLLVYLNETFLHSQPTVCTNILTDASAYQRTAVQLSLVVSTSLLCARLGTATIECSSHHFLSEYTPSQHSTGHRIFSAFS